MHKDYTDYAALVPCSPDNPVRLTQSSSDVVGRLEVCTNGIWGTVCGNRATTTPLVQVACRELNHAAIGICNILSSFFTCKYILIAQ